MSDAPPYAFDWQALAAFTGEELAKRRTHYPRAVADESMTEAEAEAGIRIMAALDADWRRIVALYAGRPAEPRDRSASPAAKREVLERAVAAARRNLDHRLADLPTSFPAGDASDRDGSIECRGFPLRDLIRMANEGRIYATDKLRAAERAEHRLQLAEALLWHAQRSPDAMFCAEMTVELRGRVAAPVEAKAA